MVKMTFSLLILMALLTACKSDTAVEADERLPSSPTWKLICVGDGFTAGVGVLPEEAYPAQLAQQLTAAGKSVKVVNAAIKGENISDLGERLDWLLQQRFDAILLVYGMDGNPPASKANQDAKAWDAVLQSIKAAQPRAAIWVGSGGSPNGYENIKKIIGMDKIISYRIQIIDMSMSDRRLEMDNFIGSTNYLSKKGHIYLAKHLSNEILVLIQK